MCLYPIKYINKKYTPTIKNGGCVPKPPIIGYDEHGFPIYDERVLYINIPCGQCIECRKQKARNWQIRLHEEIKAHKYSYFITLTFDPEELGKLMKETNNIECNATAAIAVRRCLEYYRKDHKKSLRHWLITELGHEGTERIHLHGLLFTDDPLQFNKFDRSNYYIWKYWKYGIVYVGDYCTAKTINYIVKYVNKIDTQHKGFIGQIFASPGIGKQFMTESNIIKYRSKLNGKYDDFYRLQNGSKVKLPTYYKNKLYNEEEREQMWREFMDENKITILGNTLYKDKIKGSDLENAIKKAQEFNKECGYGNNSKEWRKKPYNITKKMLESETPIQNYMKILRNYVKNLQI